MAKYEPRTSATEVSVEDFIAAVPDQRRREEARIVDALHRRVTGLEPKMWGPSIVGYSSYDYTYDSGHGGTSARAGFSPRRAAMTLYLMGSYSDAGAAERAEALFARLGPHTTGKSCLYIKRLDKVDLGVLEELVVVSWEAMNARYPV